MHDFFKLKTWLLSFILIYLSLGISMVLFSMNINYKPNIALADNGPASNVHGFAYSGLYGWVSFNCTDVPYSCNGGTNYRQSCRVAFPADCPSASCVDTCSISNYGVTVNSSTGIFSGHAWSSNAGWISFDRSETGPPPQDPYVTGNPSYIAKADLASTGKVTGWASSTYGWIRLSDDTNANWMNKGVTISLPGGIFSGYAWDNNGGTSGAGWISFNCTSEPWICVGGSNPGDPCPNGNGDCTGGVCTDQNVCANTNNYNVSMAGLAPAPDVSGLTSSHNSNSLICGGQSAVDMSLNWTSTNQAEYQVLVDDNSDFSSPVLDSTRSAGGATAFSAPTPSITYNTKYYWKVTVWNSSGISDFDTAEFTTYAHDFPRPNFTWTPPKPSKKEEFSLIGSGSIFFTAAPSTPHVCSTNPDELSCAWSWTLPADMTVAKGVIDASSTIIVTADNAGNKSITLSLTDAEGYSCSATQVVNLKSGLPNIKEVR
jgi:hypothetical protein